MRLYALVTIFLFTLIFFSASTWFSLSDKSHYDPGVSCISNHTLIHSSFRMSARYYFTFSDGRGVVRVNGKATVGNKESIISRQVFFTYIKVGNEYTLISNQIEKMSNDHGEPGGAEQHFPSFFSVAGRQFSFTAHTDRYKNLVMLFGDVPVFYCVRGGM